MILKQAAMPVKELENKPEKKGKPVKFMRKAWVNSDDLQGSCVGHSWNAVPED